MLDTKVLSIIKELSLSKEGSLLDKLTHSLLNSVSADFVFVADMSKDLTQATTLSVSTKDGITSNFSYDLAHTPCQNVSKGSTCIYTGDAQQCFPKDKLLSDMNIDSYLGVPLYSDESGIIGIFVALFTDDIKDQTSVESLFLLFAGLVSAEIEQQRYKEKLQLLSTVVENSHQAILILDENKNIQYCNTFFESLTGYKHHELLKKDSRFLCITPQNIASIQKVWLNIPHYGTWNGELFLHRKNAPPFPANVVLNAIKNDHGEVKQYLISAVDVSDQKKSRLDAFNEANFDRLTALPNAYLFTEKIAKALKHAHKNQHDLSIIQIDIDNFKAINDSVGTNLGDEILIDISKRIKHSLPEHSELSRARAVQFSILIPRLDSLDDAVDIIKSIQSALKVPFHCAEYQFLVTASIGISMYPKNSQSIEQLLYQAEQAMYASKKQGKNQFSFFNSYMQRSAEKKVALKNQLEQTLKHGGFSLAFQPIKDISLGKITKYEVLLRWSYQGKSIAPSLFIPIAEEFNLMRRIGDQVLEMACHALKRFKQVGLNDIVFAINRSVHEFPKKGEAPPNWLDVIESYDLSPSDICFEITESVLSPDNDTLLNYLHQLRDAGCQIAIDDFGTGYSSLNYIRRFPIDILKIDRSFITEIVENDSDRILVSTILAMGNALNIQIIAEGIEHEKQLTLLQQMGCNQIQGFFLSEPLDEETAMHFSQQNYGMVLGNKRINM